MYQTTSPPSLVPKIFLYMCPAPWRGLIFVVFTCLAFLYTHGPAPLPMYSKTNTRRRSFELVFFVCYTEGARIINYYTQWLLQGLSRRRPAGKTRFFGPPPLLLLLLRGRARARAHAHQAYLTTSAAPSTQQQQHKAAQKPQHAARHLPIILLGDEVGGCGEAKVGVDVRVCVCVCA